MDKEVLSTNMEYDLWIKSIRESSDLFDVFKHGTLSIGFIGLAEAIEILTNKKFWEDEKIYDMAIDIVKFMKKHIDKIKDETGLNFSLLATSGELISGRFVMEDRKIFEHNTLNKGYYTNSFHVYVDSLIPAYEKIKLEGAFHEFTNGGSITYIELKESPHGNWIGLDELINVAIESGVHYMGINFPKDVCNNCNNSGVFSTMSCSICKSTKITRIRRVSGYLEIQDFFPIGKKNESLARKENK